MITSSLSSLLLCLGLFSSEARAEPSQGGEPIQTGSNRASLLKQATLHYPADALEQRIHGDIVVNVLVDTKGRVKRTTVISGQKVFHQEAIAAANRLQFSPAIQDGQPIESSVQVSFHFAPPIHADEHDLQADHSIVVLSESLHSKETRAEETLSEETLEKWTAVDLSRSIASIPGVTYAGGTANVSKPIIRGQYERRLLLLKDGIRHESQKWGYDHAPEIDSFSAGEITVIKGANGVRYGPDAIGGVILIKPPNLREEPGVSGKIVSLLASNGSQLYSAGRIDIVPQSLPQWTFRMEGNWMSSKDVSTPSYLLGNTAAQIWNIGSVLQYQKADRTIKFSQQHYDNHSGVFYGVQNSTPAAFETQLTLDAPLTADLWTADRQIDHPKQNVSHDTLSIHFSDRFLEWTDLQVIYAYQHNDRKEHEQSRGNVTEAQYDFVLRTHSLDAHLDVDDVYLGGIELDTQLGLSGGFQENLYQGLSLIPNFRSVSEGAYLIERLIFERGALETGLRFDHVQRDSFLRERDFEEHQREGNLTDQDCELIKPVAHCDTSYRAVSYSVGTLWEIIPQHIEGSVDFSSATRFPNSDELFLLGSAPTFPVFAYGNPNIQKEQSKGISPTIAIQTKLVHTELSAYANWMTDYIYFSPDLSETGALLYKVTIRGAFPKYSFQQIDAFFYGADGGIVIAPDFPIGGTLKGSIVRGFDRDTNQFLVGIPPDQFSASIQIRPMAKKPVKTQIDVLGRFVAKQSRVDPSLDFAPAPEGYWALDADLSTTLPLFEKEARIHLIGRNITNTVYREYTSLMRYYANEKGRDLRCSITVDF